MSHDQTRSARIAEMGGISRNRALSNLRNGALQHHSIDGREAEKFVARQRFAQRLAKRHGKQMVELADILRPRVSVDMPAPRNDDGEAGR
jgi:hypothetical protein